MFQVFYHEGSIVIMNDDTENTRFLNEQETKILFNENPLLKALKDKKTVRVMLDDIHGIKDLP